VHKNADQTIKSTQTLEIKGSLLKIRTNLKKPRDPYVKIKDKPIEIMTGA